MGIGDIPFAGRIDCHEFWGVVTGAQKDESLVVQGSDDQGETAVANRPDDITCCWIESLDDICTG